MQSCVHQHQDNAPPDEAGAEGLESSKLACLLQVQGSKFTHVGLLSVSGWCPTRLSTAWREPGQLLHALCTVVFTS